MCFLQPEPAAATADSDHEDGVHDVLQEHRHRNRANKAPCPQRLCVSAKQQSMNKNHNQTRKTQQSSGYQSKGNIDEDIDMDEDADSENTDEDTIKDKGSKKRARHSDPEMPKPTTLAGYPGDWKSLLTDGKRDWKHYIVVKREDGPFPDREPHLKEARELLQNLISARRAEGEMLSGEFLNYISLSFFSVSFMISFMI